MRASGIIDESDLLGVTLCANIMLELSVTSTATVPELAAALEAPVASVRGAIKRLVTAGFIAEEKKGPRQITYTAKLTAEEARIKLMRRLVKLWYGTIREAFDRDADTVFSA